MKFEKRADGGEVTPASSETPETGKKPVIIYILILFLAAFLLMFLSLLVASAEQHRGAGTIYRIPSPPFRRFRQHRSRSSNCRSGWMKRKQKRDEVKDELKII